MSASQKRSDACPRVDLLSAYVDGDLPAARRAELERHLDGCACCREWLVALRATQHELRALADDSLGFDLSQVVRGRIEAMPGPAAPRRGRQHGRWRWFVPAGVGAAASIALGVAMGVALMAPAAAPRPVGGALEVFAPIAPGGLCAGASSCRRLPAELPR